MRKIFTTFALIIATVALFAQGIPNASFENWSTYSLGFYPNIYDFNSLQEQGDSLTILRSEDAFSGDYALHLRTILSNDGEDTMAGYAVAGRAGEMGPGGPGFAISEKPDSLILYAKYDIQPGDSAFILVVAYNNSTPVTQDFFFLEGTQATYERVAFALDTSGVRDSMFVGFTSSAILSDGDGIPGSEIWIDSLEFTGSTTQVPNAGFEEWTEITYTDPDNWESFNRFTVAHGGIQLINMVSGANAYDGNFAVKCEVVTSPSGDGGIDTTRGFLICQEFSDEFGAPEDNIGYAFDLQPEEFHFFYKYSPVGADTAYVDVQFMSNGVSVGRTTSVLFNAQASFTEVSVLNLSAQTENGHDSVIIFIYPGKNPGTELVLDALEFVLPGCSGDDTSVFAYDDTIACDEFTIDANVGDFDAWRWNDLSVESTLTVDTSGMYIVEATIIDSNCTVIDTVVVMINESTTSMVTETACDSFVAPSGKVLTTTNLHLDTIPNSVMCDSVITINLTINESSISMLTEMVCDSFVSPSGKVYTSTNLYVDTIPNSVMCDSIITIDLMVNGGGSSSITVSSCESYTSPSGKVYTMSGKYSDTVETDPGCDSIITINLTINTAMKPTITQSGNTLTSSSASSYQWYRNGSVISGATNQSYEATQNGAYQVEIEDANTCIAISDSIDVTITGLNIVNKENFTIVPNPNNGKFSVNMSSGLIGAKIIIYNIIGEQVFTAAYVKTNQVISLPEINQGIYFITIEKNELSITRKLTIN